LLYFCTVAGADLFIVQPPHLFLIELINENHLQPLPRICKSFHQFNYFLGTSSNSFGHHRCELCSVKNLFPVEMNF
jgi:hypothetical protein